jgi:hypothetical protein
VLERLASLKNDPARAVAWVTVALTLAFVLWEMHLPLLLANTTPALSDLGAHIHEPAWMRHHLLPKGRLSGWSPDWFAGYPSETFYFPLGALAIALLSFLIPYAIAFKLVAASGAILLPGAAYAFGRLNRRSHLESAALGVGVLPLLLQPILLTAGGSMAATGYGEYSYEIALALGLVVLGLAGAGMRTGRHRALTAVLLAATVLVHIVPAAMTVLGIVVLTALNPARARARWTATVLAVGGLLSGFWVVPWLARIDYTAGTLFPKASPFVEYLLPAAIAPVALIAAVAAIAVAASAIRSGDRFGLFVLVMWLLSGILFCALPASRLWNARLLAFWFLWMGVLAAIGLTRLAAWIDQERRASARGRALARPMLVQLLAPLVFLAAILPAWDTPAWKGLLDKKAFSLSPVLSQLYGGYEKAKERAEFQDFIDTIRKVGREHGCGRAHWEWNTSAWTGKRSTLMQLIPYWTDGCVAGMQGLFVESAATSPYVRLANHRLADNAVHFTAKEDVGKLDVAAGVADLRVLGVRYYVAVTPAAQQQAEATAGLRLVAQTRSYPGGSWKVFEVEGVSVVEPLAFDPVVVPGVNGSRSRWEGAAMPWFDKGGPRDVPVAAGGPSSWLRRPSVPSDPPRQPVSTPPATVSGVRLGDDSVRFHVDRLGTPIVVKVSYFPNWKATGARGPWRVTPNFMVVVPSAHDVVLRYGRTGVDIGGWAVTLAGVVGAVALWWLPEPPVPEPPPEPVEEPAPSARSSRRRAAAPKRAGPAQKRPKRRR